MWLRHARGVVKKVEALRPAMQKRSDDELKAMTETFKTAVKNGTSLNSILPEAFALVREASRRVLGMEHYPVQIIGGLALHEGKIAEMRTGEGKTLVATLPAYLNALTGKGVHVVTVNDYLAQRDAEQMGKVHNFLGLSVGVVLSASSPYHKKQAYACDITYVTNTELGFDYLRDNMAKSQAGVVMRGLEYAIIDEVDSILIDEARTPLIISGDGGDVSKVYIACDALAKMMEKSYAEKEFNRIDAMLGELEEEKGDFVIHEKDNLITLTASGIKRIENYFGLKKYSDPRNLLIQHVMDQALRANYLMHRDKDYIVRDGQVLIVDTFTGRIMDGRQFSDGLHQAIEAKEGVEIKRETKTIATTTYQNFFNKFKKVAGMTGTAATERKEFKNTYHLSTVVIPTNKPVIRVDHTDVVYLSKSGKFAAVIEDIKKTHAKGQPILVGTASVRTSEELSELLHQEHIPHRVLNAKQDQEEAEIIARSYNAGSRYRQHSRQVSCKLGWTFL
jgi:preprotein translocase subunit SecA